MSVRNEVRSLRCMFCAKSPAASQAHCGELQPVRQEEDDQVLWAHERCAEWASGVTRLPPAPEELVRDARRARHIECVACGEDGGAVGCFDVDCKRSYHYGCAVTAGCLLCTPGDDAAAWLPRSAFTERGNCLWCCDAADPPVPSCEQFYIPHAVRDGRTTRQYLESGRVVFEELVHAHRAHRSSMKRPWRTYRPGDDVLLNFGKDGAPARILKIFEDASGPEDAEEAQRDDLRATGQRAPQLVLQWYQRPGQELLEDWPVHRKDELVWLHPEPSTPGVSWDTQWASSIRHEPVRVLMQYGLEQCPVESYPLSNAKHTFTCYRKWTDGGHGAPLLLEDIDRAKPASTAADDLQWCVDGLDDDDDDDAEEQDAEEAESNEAPHGAKRRRDEMTSTTAHKRRRRSDHGTALCSLCARPERKKNEASSSAKWEGRLYEFSGRRFHEQCLLWSSGLDIEPGDERTGGRPDVSDEDVQDLLIESNDRICTRCKETGASVGCEVRSCKRVFHFLCARRVRCDFHVAVRSTPRVLCPRHNHVDLPGQHNQQARKKVSQRVNMFGAKPDIPASATAVEYEWVKIDGEFKRVPKETKAPAQVAAAASAPAPASRPSAPAPPRSGTKKFTTKSAPTARTSSSTVKTANEVKPHDDNGGELLLPTTLRQNCRKAIREILESAQTPKDGVGDGSNIDFIDLTSLREENITLDTAALRLEIALYVAFPFLDTNDAGATAKELTATGERISYPVAVASLQTILREQTTAGHTSATASTSNNDADGLLAQVLEGKICAEHLGPLVADAVAAAVAAPTVAAKEKKEKATTTAAAVAITATAVNSTTADPSEL